CHCGAESLCPPYQALGRPDLVTVVERTVVGVSNCRSASTVAAPVRSNPFAVDKHLNRGKRCTHLCFGVHQPVRNAVVSTVVLYVIVNVDPSSAALGKLVAHRWQRSHGRLVNLFKTRAPCSLELLKPPGIQELQ